MKFGILFSGQGAQYAGMGCDLYANDDLFRKVVDAASPHVGYDVAAVLNDEDRLNETKYVQPAIVAVELGLVAMLKRDVPTLAIGGMVGLSLGEYAALIASGAMPFDAGMDVLRLRAAAMQADADARPGAMAAVLNPDVEQVKQVCAACSDQDHQVVIANYNSPKQVVIGGDQAAVAAASKQLKDAGVRRVVPLKVSGAFHTPLFVNTQQQLATALPKLTYYEPDYPVISNTTGRPFEKDEIAAVLTKQVSTPTHFADCVRYMINAEQVTATLEVGPGQTLSKFTKQIDRQVVRYHVDSMDGYQQLLATLRGKE